jgi:hypothetical protein
MKTFLISYDLINKTVFDYSKLIGYIKSFSGWAKPLESVWLIQSDLDPMDIVNQIRSVTSTNDKILVVEVTNIWASFNLSKDVNDWMQQGL